MDQFVENLAAVKSIRDKLLKLYIDKIDGLSEDTWHSIKKHKFYFCRDFSMNKITKEFKIPDPIQSSGSEKETLIVFPEVRRLLCYLLLGKDFKQNWKKTVDAGIGEPLFIEIIEKVKQSAKNNDCLLYKAVFEVEDKHDLGDYSLKLIPNSVPSEKFIKRNGDDKEKLIDRIPKKEFKNSSTKEFKNSSTKEFKNSSTKEFKNSLVKDKVQVLVESKETRKSRVPMDAYINPETIVSMTGALEAIAEARNKTDLSRSEKASMVIKLCQIAADLLDGHDI
jgi:hypothetical protein